MKKCSVDEIQGMNQDFLDEKLKDFTESLKTKDKEIIKETYKDFCKVFQYRKFPVPMSLQFFRYKDYISVVRNKIDASNLEEIQKQVECELSPVFGHAENEKYLVACTNLNNIDTNLKFKNAINVVQEFDLQTLYDEYIKDDETLEGLLLNPSGEKLMFSKRNIEDILNLK